LKISFYQNVIIAISGSQNIKNIKQNNLKSFFESDILTTDSSCAFDPPRCIDNICRDMPFCVDRGEECGFDTQPDTCKDNGCVDTSMGSCNNSGRSNCFDTGGSDKACVDRNSCSNAGLACMDQATGGCTDNTCENKPTIGSPGVCVDWNNCKDTTCSNAGLSSEIVLCQDSVVCIDQSSCSNERCINSGGNSVGNSCTDAINCTNTRCMTLIRKEYVDGSEVVMCVDRQCDP
jgi:hypothetical protein